MQIRKAVDTIQNYGQAEKYITLSVNFEKFLKRKYSSNLQKRMISSAIKSLTPENLVKEFRLRGIVFGNYVTQEERFYFLFKLQGQLNVLAKLKGTKNLGLDRLIVAFGAEGVARANAHFNPAKNLININRGRKMYYDEILKGENSFIHEYAHFVDFHQGRKNTTHAQNFDSQSPGTPFAKVLDIAYNNKEYMDQLHGDYLRSKIEVFARLIEATVTHYVYDHLKDYAAFFDRQYGGIPYLSKKEIVRSKALEKFRAAFRKVRP